MHPAGSENEALMDGWALERIFFTVAGYKMSIFTGILNRPVNVMNLSNIMILFCSRYATKRCRIIASTENATDSYNTEQEFSLCLFIRIDYHYSDTDSGA